MNLNLSILARKLANLNPTLVGEPDQRLALSDVRLLAAKTQFSPEHVYFCDWERLAGLRTFPAAVICLGGEAQAREFLREHGISGLVLDTPCDLIAVFEQIQDVFSDFNALEAELTAAILQEQPLEASLDIGARLIDAPLLAIDAVFALIAASSAVPYDAAGYVGEFFFPSGVARPPYVNELKRLGLTAILNVSRNALLLDVGPDFRRSISVNCFAGGTRIASLIVAEDRRPLAHWQLGLADYLAQALTREVVRGLHAASKTRDQVRDGMEKMLLGQQIDASIMAANLARLGWNVHDDYLLLRIILPQKVFASGTAGHSKRIYERIFKDSISLDMNETFVLALHGPSVDELSGDALHSLVSTLEADGARCGMSLSFTNFMVLREQYLFAGAALERSKAENVLCRFADILPDYLLSELGQLLPLNTLCLSQVLRIHEVDRQHAGELVRTLLVYLQHERSLKSAAKELNIHRNTLVYRLNRIEKITPLHLDDAQTRLHFLLSCLILGYLDTSGSK